MKKRLLVYVLSMCIACSTSTPDNKTIPEFLLKFPKNSFASPVGHVDYVTESRDSRDEWYNAQDFTENRHLGEDWNKTSGGNTDCGEPVFSAADGEIILAKDAGPGWGNVVVIEHTAADGTQLRSLYGHLATIERSSGRVTRKQRIGTIGNADGRYKCHLHFEMRWNGSRMWDEVGPGYSDDTHGWIDPSEFIERTRSLDQ